MIDEPPRVYTTTRVILFVKEIDGSSKEIGAKEAGPIVQVKSHYRPLLYRLMIFWNSGK